MSIASPFSLPHFSICLPPDPLNNYSFSKTVWGSTSNFMNPKFIAYFICCKNGKRRVEAMQEILGWPSSTWDVFLIFFYPSSFVQSSLHGKVLDLCSGKIIEFYKTQRNVIGNHAVAPMFLRAWDDYFYSESQRLFCSQDTLY